jgi:hypothetical protein
MLTLEAHLSIASKNLMATGVNSLAGGQLNLRSVPKLNDLLIIKVFLIDSEYLLSDRR